MEQSNSNAVSDSTVHSLVQISGPVHQLNVGCAPEGHEPADVWIESVRDSGVWQHVPAGRDTAPWRQRAARAAARLAALRDEAEGRLAEDPWQEPQFAARFAERVEWVLGEPDRDRAPDLYPAEAALLALLPFLYRVQTLRCAVAHAAVEPWRLGPVPGAGRERVSFEAYADEHRLLVQRALLRPEGGAAIGWWLFHRWLARHGGYADVPAVTELLGAVGDPAAALGEVLAPSRVSRLLNGLRRGPDVCNAEFLEGLAADERLRGPGHQRVREQRLVLLAALAYAASVEATALPDVVADHLGIPNPVDLDGLRRTLAESSWGGTSELPVLRARCAHEAVVEGLRAYVVRADELLHAVSRTARSRVNHPMPPLPDRLSADGVGPAEGTFTGWAGFRLDERRVRELLMGVQLYKDRDLAVRELYQNALDACRYRRARTEYLDRTSPGASYAYEGRVSFVQETDEDGREYLECRDDGIGMGEAELRGVFSNAGARFAEQQDFREERAEWERLDPPVTLHPNSRFGIGVLSYFMLADEIRVTTCRMGRDGMPGPVLEAAVFGPGHLFRIARKAERGEAPGTVVRLYLREVEEGWSSPDVLARLLGIAEFPTEARHGGRCATWEPGTLRPRERPPGEWFGLNAHRQLLPWPDAPEGTQVVWCEGGGGLLVDGLVVRPSTRGGVLTPAGSGLAGAVVNLSGAFAPERLSADRTEVLDDLRGTLHGLLAGAVGHLVAHGGGLLDFGWLCEIAEDNAPLADLIAIECITKDRTLRHDAELFRIARTGVLPADLLLARPKLHPTYRPTRHRSGPPLHDFSVPDHILLWRQLAHRPHPALSELAELCPELDAVGPVLPALPSDQTLLTSLSGTRWDRGDDGSGLDVLDCALDLGRTPREVASRAALLGLPALPPEAFPDASVPPANGHLALSDVRMALGVPDVSAIVRDAAWTGTAVADVVARLREAGGEVREDVCATAAAVERDRFLLDYLTGSPCPWFAPGATVHPGQLASLSAEAGIPVPELVARLERCGLVASGNGLPERPRPEFSGPLHEKPGAPGQWLSRSAPVPPGHVLAAAEQWRVTPAEAMARFAELGFVPPEPFPDAPEPYDSELLAGRPDPFVSLDPPLRPGHPVPYAHPLAAAARLGMPLRDVTARLGAYGIDVPLRGPTVEHPLDATLFQEGGPLDWHGVTTADPFPFAHVLAAARNLFADPEEIAARLTDWGIELSCSRLPEGLSYPNALTLLSGRRTLLLTASDHVTFSDLLDRAHTMHEPVRRVHSWLTRLGIPTVDPVRAVRDALPLIPLARPPAAP
ncbi:ATP-binding protein [Streptomyces sp. NPDC050504]|uniref:wHTH domain-containing protein n=1 Tax=Streptomyces sp. NPDC050504 TaxID=3365618 RepID=UPI003789545A